MITGIGTTEVKTLVDSGSAVVLEVLPAAYYESGHLPGALLLPPDALDAQAPLVAPDRDRTIVVYCSNAACNNSHVAARRLDQLGYADVRRYVGGKEEWSAAGLPLEVATRA